MNKNPFKSDVTEKTFYHFQSLQQRLDLLIRIFSGGSRLILVVGCSGSGKTLLMKQFLAHDETNWKRCRINAKNPMDEEKNFMLDRMKEHKAYIYSKGEYPVIMMDNLHELNSEELLFLIQMTGSKGYVRLVEKLVLFCEPEFVKKLSDFSESIPEEGLIDKIHMPALTRDETEEYLNKWIFSSGHVGASSFTHSDIDSLYDESGGWPGIINLKAAELLERKPGDEKKLVSFFKNILLR